MTASKNELKSMAIETAYSSKGHFKTADWMSISLGAYVSVSMVTSLVTTFFTLPEIAARAVSFAGLYILRVGIEFHPRKK